MTGMVDLRGYLIHGTLDRRNFVKRAAALALSAPAIGTLLAACGGSDDKATATKGADAGTTPTGGAGAEPTATTKITVDLNATATPATVASPTSAAPGASPTTAAASTPTSAPLVGKKGGKVTLVRSDEADIYDPVLNDANTVIWIIGNVYETLVKSNKGSDGLDPGLAEKYEVSDDGITVTFHLRDAKFSDGSALTTDDVIFSLERARDTVESVWTFTMTQAKEITAPDDKTVQVTLSQPWAPFLAGVAMFNGGIVSKAYFEANAVDTNTGGSGEASKGIGVAGMASMGTGPYVIADWQTDQFTLLKRNEHYWAEGLPYRDEIKILQVPDVNNGILQIQGGDVDGLVGQTSVPFNRVAELQKDTNLQVLIWPASYAGNVQFNIEKPPLNDLHFRRALNHATDVATLIQTAAFGLAEPGNSFMPIGSLYWNPDQKPYPFDLEMAKSELAQSTTPTGGKVEVLTVTGNAQEEVIATTLQDMWSQIGVELTITPMDGQTRRQRLLDHDFQMRIAAWTNDMIDPDEIVGYFIIPDNSENARSGWVNQHAVDVAHQAQAEQDPEKRRQMYYEIQKIYKEEGPMIYTYNIPYVDVLRANIKGYHHNPLGAYTFTEMFIDE
jgi:peptide/nickel transport system substrate-binding protein